MARPPDTTEVAQSVFAETARRGLLLQTGSGFPSATTLICGEPIKGPWWSHPQSSLIHWVLEELDDNPELTTAKLIDGKVTMVHSALWPELVAIGKTRESWQMRKLTPLAKALLSEADRRSIRLDEFESRLEGSPTDTVRFLERRLLIHTSEVHTERGRHSKQIQNWQDWWAAAGDESGALPHVDDAKARFHEAVEEFGVNLPW